MIPEAVLAPNAPNSIHRAEFGTFADDDPSLVGQHLDFQWVLQDPTGNGLGVS